MQRSLNWGRGRVQNPHSGRQSASRVFSNTRERSWPLCWQGKVTFSKFPTEVIHASGGGGGGGVVQGKVQLYLGVQTFESLENLEIHSRERM
jgi:hypothetical protein